MGVTPNSYNNKEAAMDAIKKKMQAMKVEKDNAMDRSDVCEQAAKDAKVRAAKAEEEVAELVKKAQQLEVELDKTKEELSLTTEKLKERRTIFFPLSWKSTLLTGGFRALRETLRPVRTSFSRPPTSLTKLPPLLMTLTE